VPAGWFAFDEDIGAAVADLALRLARAEGGRHQQVLKNGQLFEGLRDLECPADAGKTARHRRLPGDINTIEPDSTGIDANIAGNQIEQRGFARAVRPDHPERLAIFQIERDHVGDLEGAEALR
jgi:hypothetical protein